MFSQSIANAEKTAQQTIAQPVPNSAQFVITDTQNFLDKGIPPLKQTQKSISSFAVNALAEVTQIVNKLNSGSAPSTFKSEIDSLKASTSAKENELNQSNAAMVGYRNQFSNDGSRLNQLHANFEAQIKVQKDQISRQQSEVNKINDRIKWINRMSIVCPWLKLASELESLITTQKTTEANLNDAQKQLSREVLDLNHLNIATSQIQNLEHSVGGLQTVTQNLVNSITIISGSLQNEQEFLDDAKDQAILFMTALKSNLQELVNEAS